MAYILVVYIDTIYSEMDLLFKVIELHRCAQALRLLYFRYKFSFKSILYFILE